MAQIIYTSGTTGIPKGAMITQGNIDCILLVLPLYHAYAKLQGMVVPFRMGVTVYMEERFFPD